MTEDLWQRYVGATNLLTELEWLVHSVYVERGLAALAIKERDHESYTTLARRLGISRSAVQALIETATGKR